MLVGQLLGENLGRQRAAGQFAAGYCMFLTHTIVTPMPASEKMLAFAARFMCKHHGGGGGG
jgi:hypothetical protein